MYGCGMAGLYVYEWDWLGESRWRHHVFWRGVRVKCELPHLGECQESNAYPFILSLFSRPLPRKLQTVSGDQDLSLCTFMWFKQGCNRKAIDRPTPDIWRNPGPCTYCVWSWGKGYEDCKCALCGINAINCVLQPGEGGVQIGMAPLMTQENPG